MQGKEIDRYEIIGKLGKGGMATVYLAHDPHFERDVAVKVLPQALLHDEKFLARFEREAKTIAKLEHPSIVPVYDYGQHEGQPFIVMRYMPGGSLNELMERGDFTSEEILKIVSRIAEGLQEAHSKGVIHRDLKPRNILFDGGGLAYLADFGIAKLNESTTNLTGTGLVGTPAYMSPEQIYGDKELDGRSDVYALGIILFEMLTGKKPFEADTPVKLIMKHLNDPIPDLTSFRGDYPEPLKDIIEKSLAKDRSERYDTPLDLTSELKGVLRAMVKELEEEKIQLPPVEKEPSIQPDAVPVQHPPVEIEPNIQPDAAPAQADPVISESVTRDAIKEDFHGAIDVPHEKVQSVDREVRVTQPRNWTWAYVIGGIAAVALLAWGATQLDFSGAAPAATAVEELVVVASATPAPETPEASEPEEEPVTPVPTQNWQEFARYHENGAIQEFALSPDQSMLAIASATNLMIYDYPAMTLRFTHENGTGFSSVAWSPDATRIVLGGVGTRVYIWDIENDREVVSFDDHEYAVNSVDWSPDGEYVVSGDDAGKVLVWSANDGLLYDTFSRHDDAVIAVAWSPDGNLIASASADNTARVWGFTRSMSTVFEVHTSQVRSIAWSSDSTSLASGESMSDADEYSDIYVWNAETGEIEASFIDAHQWWVSNLVWVPDERKLISTGWDGKVGVWDVDRERASVPIGYFDSLVALEYFDIENKIVFANRNGVLRTAKMSNYAVTDIPSNYKGTIQSFAVSPDGTQFLVTTFENYIAVEEFSSGDESFELIGHPNNVTDAAWSPNNAWIATVGGWNDYSVRIWDALDGTAKMILYGNTDEVLCLAWSPDETMIASGSLDGATRIWDIDSPTPIKLFEHEGEINELAWSPDGQLLAIASSDGIVYVYDVESETLMFSLTGFSNGVRALAWSPDGAYLAAGGQQEAIRIFDMNTGYRKTSLVERGAWLQSLAWSPDGAYLADGRDNGIIYIWDTRTLLVVATISGHADAVIDVYWSADGMSLYSGSRDGTVRIWQLIE